MIIKDEKLSTLNGIYEVLEELIYIVQKRIGETVENKLKQREKEDWSGDKVPF